MSDVIKSEFGTRVEVPAIPDRPDLTERAEALAVLLEDMTITSASLYKEVNDIRGEAARTQDVIKEVYREPREYYNEKHKAVTAKQNGLVGLFKDVENTAKSLLKAYDQEQERIAREEAARVAREAEEILRKEREVEAERLAEQGRDDEAIEILEKPSQVVAPPKVKIQAAASGNSYRDNWTARVVDPQVVPRQFLIVDERALNAFAKATKGQNPVAGVEFVNDKILVGKK